MGPFQLEKGMHLGRSKGQFQLEEGAFQLEGGGVAFGKE